jgi:hypothetical protein
MRSLRLLSISCPAKIRLAETGSLTSFYQDGPCRALVTAQWNTAIDAGYVF